MKLGCSNPWRKRSAIHSQSVTAVLRPGTALIWRALTTTTSKDQQVIHRLPIDPRRLHGDVRAASGRQPIRPAEEVVRHGPERAHFLAQRSAGVGDEQAGHHRALMDIDSATPRMYYVHGAILSLPTGTIRVDGGRGSAR